MDASDFNGRLLKGEKIVWWGQPAQGLLLTSRDWLLIPFSLAWGGMASYITVKGTNADILSLVPLVFVLVALYLVVGRFLFDAWIRRGICYAVTDKRVLILRSGSFSKFTALSLDHLPDVNLNEQPGGRGTIRFGTVAPFWTNQGFSWTPSFDPTPPAFLRAD